MTIYNEYLNPFAFLLFEDSIDIWFLGNIYCELDIITENSDFLSDEGGNQIIGSDYEYSITDESGNIIGSSESQQSLILDENNKPILYSDDDFYNLSFNIIEDDNIIADNVINNTIIFSSNIIGNIAILEIFENCVIFGNELKTKDFILTWYGRTKTARLGYGASPYGEIFGFGEGKFIDIDYWIVKVIKTSDSTVLQEAEVDISNIEEGYSNYIYSYSQNILDNGSFVENLTFELYQVNLNGDISLVSSVVYTN